MFTVPVHQRALNTYDADGGGGIELCAERGRLWLDPAERWRSYPDDEDEPRLFCPGCAQSEGFRFFVDGAGRDRWGSPTRNRSRATGGAP